MHRSARVAVGLAAVGAATAVGLTTHEPGFTVITFFGTLLVPRILGIGGLGGHGRGAWGPGCGARHRGRAHLEARLEGWHREAHREGDARAADGGASAPGVTAGISPA